MINDELVELKIQKRDKTSSTSGKYSKGVHIKMRPDGVLENDYDIYRDVQPIVNDLVSKWKFKLEKI